MDRGQKDTYKELTKLEKKINREYAEAIKDIEYKLSDYLRRFESKDKVWREWVEDGEKTVEEYQKWRLGQMAVGKRWSDQKEAIAKNLFKVNTDLREKIRSEMPQVFAENFNFATYELEKAARVDTAFTLYNKEAAQRILEENPDLLPPMGRRVKGLITQGKAVAWDMQKLQSVMVQGILQGDSIPHLATRLAKGVGESDRKAAIRNARTMATGAQNAGRVAAYARADELGVEMEQMWIATLDDRTRHSHRYMDGETRPVGEAFSNGCMYPADPAGEPEEVYNCRCSLRGVVKGLERKAYKYRDESGMEGMSYDEWRDAHERSNSLTLPEEKGEAIRQSYLAEYRKKRRH